MDPNENVKQKSNSLHRKQLRLEFIAILSYCCSSGPVKLISLELHIIWAEGLLLKRTPELVVGGPPMVMWRRKHVFMFTLWLGQKYNRKKTDNDLWTQIWFHHSCLFALLSRLRGDRQVQHHSHHRWEEGPREPDCGQRPPGVRSGVRVRQHSRRQVPGPGKNGGAEGVFQPHRKGSVWWLAWINSEHMDRPLGKHVFLCCFSFTGLSVMLVISV